MSVIIRSVLTGEEVMEAQRAESKVEEPEKFSFTKIKLVSLPPSLCLCILHELSVCMSHDYCHHL